MRGIKEMNIRMKPIRSRENIENVVEGDECIYIGFRPSSKDLIQIIKSAPSLRIVYIPKSYTKTLSQSMIMLLEMKNIHLMVGGIQSSSNVESCFILNDVELPDVEQPEPVSEPVDEPVSEPVDEPVEKTPGEEDESVDEPVMKLEE